MKTCPAWILVLLSPVLLATFAHADAAAVDPRIDDAFQDIRRGQNDRAVERLREVFEEARQRPLTEQVTPIIDASYLALEISKDDFANEMINHLLNAYEEAHGPQSDELIDVSLTMAERLNYGAKRALAMYAMSISKAANPEDALAHAHVEVRAGRILANDSVSQPEAREMLAGTLATLEQAYGAHSPELIPALMALGHANLGLFDGRLENATMKRRRLYTRAVRIAEKSGDGLLYASTLYDAGEELMAGNPERGMIYLHKSVDAYEALLGAEHPRTGMAALQIAQLHADENVVPGARLQKDSKKFAERAVMGFRDGPDHVEEHISALGIIARYYEMRGKHKKATPYVLEIAQRRADANGGNAEPYPIRDVVFIRPASMARAQVKGTVSVEFIIDEEGYVRELSVTDADVRKSVQSLVTETLEDWRYSPKMVNGKPVAEVVSTTFPFDWERSGRGW